jgi:hypothetical protein
MDRDENLYFDEFSKKSLSEIQEMFQNLKHIGMSDEDIDKYAKQYKDFFESRVKATGFKHIDGVCESKHAEAYREIERREKVYDTSIPWREKLMERAEIKKTLRDELMNSTFSEVSKDQVQTDLSQSVVSEQSFL